MIDTPLLAHEPPPGYLRTADLLAALSLASDLAVGLPAEHAVRSCYIAMHVAQQMQVPAEQQIDLYYAMLLMDAGCTAWTSQLAGLIVSTRSPRVAISSFTATPATPSTSSAG